VNVRWLGVALLAALAVGGLFVGQGVTAGPGGWDHVGDAGTPGTKSLNGNVMVMNTDAPGRLLVGGAFTDAGGNALADHIASWNGSQWAPVGAAGQQIPGDVFAIAYANGKIYAGGSFTNAGGNANADFLAVWDGQTWAPFCNPAAGGPAFTGNVKALQVIGSTLYVGGEFQDAAGLASADYLVACELATGAASSTVADPAHPFSGSVYALTADGNGVLYAGGGFTNLENIPEADNVAYSTGNGWLPMGSGAGGCQCAVNTFVRSLTAVGTDVYVGTDAHDVAGIAQADNVVRWDGTAWSAVGSGTGGANGWFPASTSINALTAASSHIFAAGSFQNANGDPRADHIAFFDGTDWHPLGSDGAGNGPLNAQGLALAAFGARTIYAAGSFTSAGGDSQARSIASFNLAQVIAYPTPTVTPSPSPQPTPTVTPSPAPVPTPVPTPTPAPPPDTKAPAITVLRLSHAVFRAARSGPSFHAARAARAPVGTTVSFTLSEPGTVRFTIDRSTAGRTVKGRCVTSGKANRARPSCRRWVAQRGSFNVAGTKGLNRITLRGRIGGRTLAPGVYRLVARETDRSANRSRVKRTGFTIVR
jgi:hypothetical protein